MSETNTCIQLKPASDITQVHHYYKMIASEVAENHDLNLDGSAVTSIDGAFLQLLAVTFNTAETNGLNIAWTGASESLVAAAKLLGLTELLRLH